ncbi:MAG TPA: ChbG/HpnK family deacetylase, partial [Blastocatellia bacterium]|nr:ChbG/HpnK family deacetylase [Blastocatellia bacterium]
YRRLAKEYDLPLRMASQELLAERGAPGLRKQLEEDGILCPDYLIHGGRKSGESITDYWHRMLKDLKPGVTELYIHAALPGEEMKHITNSWQERATEYELFTKAPEIRRLLESQNVKRIGFRPLRDLQRKARKAKDPAGALDKK